MSRNPEYEKMPKNVKGLGLSEKDIHALSKLKWVVTEKVHGANFSFLYEDHQLRFAKRKDYLEWSDDFFGFQVVAAELEDRVLALFEQLKQDVPAYRYIVYGELFGGKYPHPDVAPDANVQAIQTGVYYSPVVRFCAFDIAVETEDGGKIYLDYETSMRYFERFGIFYAQVLFTGKWNEVLVFDTRINSRIPAQLGLPELAQNMIEGVVIKPLKHASLTELSTRPVIKLKNPEFDEEQKFHEAEKWSYVPDVTSRSEELSFLVDEIARHITTNRLNSALSKTGAMDRSNEARMQAIRKEFLDDIFIDFNADNGNILDALDTGKIQWLRDRTEARIVLFISGIG